MLHHHCKIDNYRVVGILWIQLFVCVILTKSDENLVVLYLTKRRVVNWLDGVYTRNYRPGQTPPYPTTGLRNMNLNRVDAQCTNNNHDKVSSAAGSCLLIAIWYWYCTTSMNCCFCQRCCTNYSWFGSCLGRKRLWQKLREVKVRADLNHPIWNRRFSLAWNSISNEIQSIREETNSWKEPTSLRTSSLWFTWGTKILHWETGPNARRGGRCGPGPWAPLL